MNIRALSVVSMFIVSCIVGYNMFPITETVQAQAPVFISPVELMNMMPKQQEKELSTPEIDVEIDLSTKEVTINSTVDAKINVKTTNEPAPVVKYRTKVIEKVATVGYPYSKTIGHMPDSVKAVSPLTIVNNNGQ